MLAGNQKYKGTGALLLNIFVFIVNIFDLVTFNTFFLKP